jgi:hypothetical protein
MTHFATAERVGFYLLGRNLRNIIVLVNEKSVLHLKDIPNADLSKILRILEEEIKCTVVNNPN